jgi:hypothetical protein
MFKNILKHSSIVAIAIVTLVIGVLVGCQKEEDIPIDSEIKIPEKVSSFNSWQEQLDYVIKDENKILSAQGLKLIRYDAEDQKDYTMSALNEDLLVPVYLSLNINRFVLLNIHDRRLDKTSYTKRKSEIIDTFEGSERKTVRLLWDNNGQQFTSYCVISEERQCIVYDDVLSNIRFVKIDKNIKKTITPRLKNGNENTNRYTLLIPLPAHSITGFFGNTKASAGGSLSLKGTTDENGKKDVTSYNSTCHQTANAGYSAAANITVTAFVSGPNGYIEYSWGVMVGETSSLTLGWNGSSYSIPGGASGMSGSSRINFSEL